MKLAVACAVLVACGGGTQGGSFSLDWDIILDTQSVDCLQASVFDVEVVTTAEGETLRETFDCFDMTATTGPRSPGSYVIDVNALDIDGEVLATSTDTGTIVDGLDADLGTFPLVFGSTVCDSSTCTFGCCDGNTCIEPQSDSACGRSGATCSDCAAIGQVCSLIDGVCIE